MDYVRTGTLVRAVDVSFCGTLKNILQCNAIKYHIYNKNKTQYDSFCETKNKTNKYSSADA
jgi:hypothetical protein